MMVIAGVCAALLGAILLVWYWLRRRRKALPLAEPTPDIPPEREALEALETLEAAGLPARGLLKEFYTRLSDILRRYLARRFDVPAVDMTSAELMDALGPRLGRSPAWEPLEALCMESDMAKFAKWIAPEARCREALQRVRFVVSQTSLQTGPSPQRSLPQGEGAASADEVAQPSSSRSRVVAEGRGSAP